MERPQAWFRSATVGCLEAPSAGSIMLQSAPLAFPLDGQSSAQKQKRQRARKQRAVRLEGRRTQCCYDTSAEAGSGERGVRHEMMAHTYPCSTVVSCRNAAIYGRNSLVASDCTASGGQSASGNRVWLLSGTEREWQ